MYFNKKDGYRQLNVRQLGSLRPSNYGRISSHFGDIQRQRMT